MWQRQTLHLQTIMLFVTSTCCFLAAVRLHEFGIYWESLAALGFCTNPFVHQLVAMQQPERSQRRQPALQPVHPLTAQAVPLPNEVAPVRSSHHTYRVEQ